jgi:hypothetical protein
MATNFLSITLKDVEKWAQRSVWPLLSQLRSSVDSTRENSGQDAAMQGEEGAGEGQRRAGGAQGAASSTASAANSRSEFGQWRARLELFMYEASSIALGAALPFFFACV